MYCLLWLLHLVKCLRVEECDILRKKADGIYEFSENSGVSSYVMTVLD